LRPLAERLPPLPAYPPGEAPSGRARDSDSKTTFPARRGSPPAPGESRLPASPWTAVPASSGERAADSQQRGCVLFAVLHSSLSSPFATTSSALLDRYCSRPRGLRFATGNPFDDCSVQTAFRAERGPAGVQALQEPFPTVINRCDSHQVDNHGSISADFGLQAAQQISQRCQARSAKLPFDHEDGRVAFFCLRQPEHRLAEPPT
jgi:hypothetical protein